MRKIFIILFPILSLFISACTGASIQPTNKDTLNVVTSFYPLYEIAKKVGAEHVNVLNMVPAGSEPHDYEPTPSDIINLNKADLILYNGGGMEPWSDRIIPDLQKNGIQALNLSDLLKNNILKNTSADASEGEYLPYDPHIWMDPTNYMKEAQIITEKLIEIDPNHQEDYRKNSQNFIGEIQILDQDYQNGLKKCTLNSFITNHAAFAYLANRYQLEMIPIAGVSPDSEPSPQTMAEVVKMIQQKNIHYILTESLMNPKVADTLASETGAKTLVLNPLEGLTDTEIANGKNYIEVMKDNLKNLRIALECQ